ncbi:MAG: preprotein translocase subunit YajC [Planctomycetota bacterium]|jgi:preprotein translocase subunit YajC
MIDFDLELFTLAQGEGTPPAPGAGALPPPPGEGTPLTGAPGDPAGSGGQSPPSSPFGGSLFMMLLLVFGAMIVFSFLGQRRDRKKRQAMISAVKKHDKVQTVGGVIGSVMEVKPDTVVLKVDESSNTRITFARSAIQQVLTSGPAGDAPSIQTADQPAAVSS